MTNPKTSGSLAARVLDSVYFENGKESVITHGARNVFIENEAAASMRAVDSNHEATSGAPGVFVNRWPILRVGDTVAGINGNGIVRSNARTVLIGNRHRNCPTNSPRLHVQLWKNDTSFLSNTTVEIIQNNSIVTTTHSDAEGKVTIPMPRWGNFHLRIPDGQILRAR